ncbi:MAG: translation initiation factor IF-2 [Candidatus Uhrbacteria bacterium]
MNVTELARRLNVNPEELMDKLPELGFSVGKRAIKVDDRIANQIMEAWGEYKRRQKLKAKRESQQLHTGVDEVESVEKKPVALPKMITVREFAGRLDLPVAKVMQELMRSGILASLNENIDFETAAIIASDLGFEAIAEGEAVDHLQEAEIERVGEILENEDDQVSEPRPPVIVVMGHVDHGKTKLLDAIRSTNVVDQEAGGITQHIGAYQVVRQDHLLTFIDTPGHEAFTVMRSRGAKVADIAILVVAVDDGVQPQTREAIDIIKASGMPFIVALNKIDKAEQNIERVKGQLAELGLQPEDWGGNTIMVPISAKNKINIDGILDVLILVADMEKEKITANPNRPAIGTVIDSKIDAAAGPVVTALVQTGTLRVGDPLGVHGMHYGKVKAMKDWQGQSVVQAGPSTPVLVLGFKAAPTVGDVLEVPSDEKKLDKVKFKPAKAASVEEVTTARIIHTPEDGENQKPQLTIIVKADVLGSLEALLGMIEKVQKNPHVEVKILKKGLGDVTDSEVMSAEASGAVIYAFNVKPSQSAFELSREKNVEIFKDPIIYKIFENIIERVEKLLPSEMIYEEVGKVEVKANFKKTDNGWIIGGKVVEGSALADCKLRIMRDSEIIGEGVMLKLQSSKQNTTEVLKGQECGIQYKGKVKADKGDLLELYKEAIKQAILKIDGVSKR